MSYQNIFHRKKRTRKVRSYGELEISNYLNINNIQFIKEYTFDKCRSLKNNLLRFDFYLIDYNVLIEFQGQHHYFPINKNPKSKFVHNKTKINDKIKLNFCNYYKLPLITIPYYQKNKIGIILDEFLKT